MAEQLTKTNYKQEVAKAIGDTTIADSIINSMVKLAGQEAISFPKGYDFGSNLKLAYLNISQNGYLQKSTVSSVGEALVEMSLQGLEIVKKQCYFFPYGNKLTMFRSYFGDVAALEKTGLVKIGETKAVVVYEGDEIEVEVDNDEEVLKSFKANTNVFERHNKKIIGAYATTTLINGNKKYVFMSKEEIDKAWAKSKDPTRNVQKDFPQEMSKRTVLRRLSKYITNFSSSIESLTPEQRNALYSYIRTTEEQYDSLKQDSTQRSSFNIPTIEVEEEKETQPIKTIDLTQKEEQPQEQLKEQEQEPLEERQEPVEDNEEMEMPFDFGDVGE